MLDRGYCTRRDTTPGLRNIPASDQDVQDVPTNLTRNLPSHCWRSIESSRWARQYIQHYKPIFTWMTMIAASLTRPRAGRLLVISIAPHDNQGKSSPGLEIPRLPVWGRSTSGLLQQLQTNNSFFIWRSSVIRYWHFNFNKIVRL